MKYQKGDIIIPKYTVLSNYKAKVVDYVEYGDETYYFLESLTDEFVTPNVECNLYESYTQLHISSIRKRKLKSICK